MMPPISSLPLFMVCGVVDRAEVGLNRLSAIKGLFEKPSELRKRRSRYDIYKQIDASYYGYRDYKDEVLDKVERGAEERMGAESRVGEEEDDVVMEERREREREMQEEKEKEFVGQVSLSDEKEIEKMVLEKKMKLLSKYASEELLEEEREAKAILNIHR
ncbi:pre-mRNA-splicing factor ISY1 [Tanacetum coccineum]